MAWTRREVLAAGAGGLLGLAAPAEPATPTGPRLGLVLYSFAVRRAVDREHRLDDPLVFLEHCHALGAGGVQTALGVRPEAEAEKVRALAARHGLHVEGIVSLPRDRADAERFAAELRTAKRCGATVARAVLTGGRRYEALDSAEAFRAFLDQGRQALGLARPLAEREEVRLAVENHKDLQAAELADLVRKQDSPFVGVCVDTGNNVALLEKPQETVEALAPHALSVHLKDMGVEEYADGFLLSEVPLGTGFLDLPALVATLRRGRPELRLNLEMITRDPLKIPCLTPKYWATLEHVPGRKLAELLSLVRAKAGKLPRLSELGREEQLQREEDNVRRCLRWAGEHL